MYSHLIVALDKSTKAQELPTSDNSNKTKPCDYDSMSPDYVFADQKALTKYYSYVDPEVLEAACTLISLSL
jgi:hypothetical protein